MIQFLQEKAKESGFAISIKYSTGNRNVSLQCDRGGDYRRRAPTVAPGEQRKSTTKYLFTANIEKILSI
jgi:hypothetical protein